MSLTANTRPETDRAPVVLGDQDNTYHVTVTRLPHLDRLVYWTARTGRTLAVRFWAAKAPGQRNPSAVSPVCYLPLQSLPAGITDDQLVCLATHALAAWVRRARMRYDHELLVVACRAYRDTHREVLKTVGMTMVGRYGLDWWADEHAVRTARETLRQFGVAV
jgi:hypothetical protein